MTIFGIDISHHQAGIDLQKVKNEGFDFVIARVGQGAGGQYGTTRDREWIRHRNECRRVGLRLCAYWYIGSNITARDNATLCKQWMGDPNIPVALDCEVGSGDISFYRSVLDSFVATGLRVPLSYIPRWYWQQVGSSSLSGLPPLWSSRYVVGTGVASQLYPGDGSSHWSGYGGNTIQIAQFTSSAKVAGRNVDANAFRGSLAQLDTLLFGAPAPPVDPPPIIDPEPVEEPDMQLTDIIGYRSDGSPITVGDALRTASEPEITKKELFEVGDILEALIKDRTNYIINQAHTNAEQPTWEDLETLTWSDLATKKWGKII